MACTSLLLAGLSAVLFLFIIAVRQAQSYWKNYNVTTPPYHFLLGHSLPRILKQKAAWQQIKEFYDEYKGSVAMIGLYFATKPAVLALDLDLVKRVLITDFEVFNSRGVYVNEEKDPISAHLFSIGGAKWRKLRAKLSPTFTSGKMKAMCPTMVQISSNFTNTVERIMKESPEGFKIKNVTSRYTTDVIGSCAFGLECNSLLDPDNLFRKMGDEFFRGSFKKSIISMFRINFPDLARFLGIKVVAEEVSEFFTQTVEDTVKYRESSTEGLTRNDFMDLLVTIKNDSNAADRLTVSEIVSQSFIFFVAGFETSSSTMMFCLFELAKRPDIQDKARKHIQEKMAGHDGELNYDSLMEMDYLEKVINGALEIVFGCPRIAYFIINFLYSFRNPTQVPTSTYINP